MGGQFYFNLFLNRWLDCSSCRTSIACRNNVNVLMGVKTEVKCISATINLQKKKTEAKYEYICLIVCFKCANLLCAKHQMTQQLKDSPR